MSHLTHYSFISSLFNCSDNTHHAGFCSVFFVVICFFVCYFLLLVLFVCLLLCFSQSHKVTWVISSNAQATDQKQRHGLVDRAGTENTHSVTVLLTGQEQKIRTASWSCWQGWNRKYTHHFVTQFVLSTGLEPKIGTFCQSVWPPVKRNFNSATRPWVLCPALCTSDVINMAGKMFLIAFFIALSSAQEQNYRTLGAFRF